MVDASSERGIGGRRLAAAVSTENKVDVFRARGPALVAFAFSEGFHPVSLMRDMGAPVGRLRRPLVRYWRSHGSVAGRPRKNSEAQGSQKLVDNII